jgi:hypothetical protein
MEFSEAVVFVLEIPEGMMQVQCGLTHLASYLTAFGRTKVRRSQIFPCHSEQLFEPDNVFGNHFKFCHPRLLMTDSQIILWTVLIRK